jgi:molybdopterin molybdotransferase
VLSVELSGARAFLVLARHHLAEQAEGEELEADHDEQDAQDQQWPVSDCLAGCLQDGEVEENSEPDRREQQPEAAEKMERAVPVAADECDGQKVEEAAQVALRPVTGTAVGTRPVVDGKLGDPEAAVVREHRQEPVQLAVDPQPVQHLGPVRLEPTVEVVQPQTRDAARRGVEDPREGTPEPGIPALCLPAGDEVEALVELRQKARNLGRIVLEVGVDGHDGVAARVREPGRKRGGLAEVPAQPNHADVAVRCVESRECGEASIGGTVVDEDDFPRGLQRLEGGSELVVQRGERQLLVVDGHHDRDHEASSVFDLAQLLALEEAQRIVLERARPLGSEGVSLRRAHGRVLAEPARARVDLPPFASSAMDGFAIRAGDTPGELRIAEISVAAGSPAGRPLEPGEAAPIATGGVVPEGADAVVPIELVVQVDNTVEIASTVETGAHVRPQGGDAEHGDVVVEAGRVLGPAQLGALAAAGIADVVCSRRPRVAVLATGSELRQPGEPLDHGQIYEANGVMLASQLESAGAVVTAVESVADEPADHRRALGSALDGDLVLSSGGVSVGPHDLVRTVAMDLGVEEIFWRVAVKPGKPVWFGARGATLVLALPGNPVSSLVGFELFVRPALLARQGAVDPRPDFAAGVLAQAVRRNAARDEFVRARRVMAPDAVRLEPLEGQESHMIARAALADSLVHVPRGEGELASGTSVRYLSLR